MTAPKVSSVRMIPSSKAEAESGLFGYVSFRLGPVLVDGVTLRRTLDGDLTLSYPARRDGAGRDHPYIRPLNGEVRQAIEAQILEALDIGEVEP